MLKVSIVEASRVFEAGSQHSIQANMCRPDVGKRQKLLPRREHSDNDQNAWREQGVNEVVDRSANSSIDKIPEHEEIRREKENRKQNPACVAFAVKQNTHTESSGAFDAKQQCGLCEHLRILARRRNASLLIQIPS